MPLQETKPPQHVTSATKLIITPKAKAIIEADAAQTYPHECCGFLLGRETDLFRIIFIARETRNKALSDQKRRFEISATDYMNAERYADENKMSLLGIYHSHPDHPAIPSEFDLKQALPFFSYLIISVRKGNITNMLSWRLNERSKFAEEEVLFEIPAEIWASLQPFDTFFNS